MHGTKRVFPHALLVVIIFLSIPPVEAGTVVYKEVCERNHFENWNAICKINKNVFSETGLAGTSDFEWLSQRYNSLKSIVICASFSNRGGLISPVIIVHNYKNGEQAMPASLFDTVKFKGNPFSDTVTWIGTSFRNINNSMVTVHGVIRHLGVSGFAYTETVLNGRRKIGEVDAVCEEPLD